MCCLVLHVVHHLLATSIINLHYIAPTISFASSRYNVQENTGKVQVELVLSDPLSTDVEVTVNSRDRKATGE